MTEITFFAGITGIDKSGFIQNLIEKSGKSDDILHINFEEELTNKQRPGLVPSNIPDFLDIPNPYSKVDIIQKTFDWVTKKITTQPEKKYIFFNIHLSYYKNSEFFPPLNLVDYSSMVEKISKPTVKVITLIDDIFSIWQRIKEKEQVFFKTRLRLREILSWRSLESIQAESLKTWFTYNDEGGLSVSNYLVSVRHPYSTFQNLIFNNIPTTMYLSYPITYPRTDPESMCEVNEYRNEMHIMGEKLGVSIFDPVTIDEFSLVIAMKKALDDKSDVENITLQESDRWELNISNPLVSSLSWPIEIPTSEIKEVENTISDQIQARDYALVDAANILAVYRPFYKGHRSDGVDAEIKHAKEVGNTVVVYSLEDDEKQAGLSSSPFSSKTHHYRVKEEFIEHLLKLINNDKEMDK